MTENMIAIIPAKVGSTRVPYKNWKHFHGGKSLLDIHIEKLLPHFPSPEHIIVASDGEDELTEINTRYGVYTLHRSAESCDNATNYSRVVGELADTVARVVPLATPDCDVLWTQVCDPLLDPNTLNFMFNFWQQVIPKVKDNTGKPVDSLCVAHAFRGYLMDQNLRPMGWGFGNWHVASQNLPTYFTFPFTASIMSLDTLRSCRYPVGHNPHFAVTRGPHVDIDTEEDFEVAQLYYAKLQERAQQKRELDGQASEAAAGVGAGVAGGGGEGVGPECGTAEQQRPAD